MLNGIAALTLTCLVAVTFSALATDGPRVRLNVPPDGLRLNVLSFSRHQIPYAVNGEIREQRFYPKTGFTLAMLGANSCAGVLNTLQAFPLQAMLQSKYITQEVYDALRSVEKYLDPEQVTFANVYSVLPKEFVDANRTRILSSQLAMTPEWRGNDAAFIPITTATLYLIRGFKRGPNGETVAPMPWTVDPTFAPLAPAIIGSGDGLDFEIGRAAQVAPRHMGFALDALLIALAHDVAATQGHRTARIFVHSYKTENTIAYQRRTPSLKVVATDPENPENVILMTTLQEATSEDNPWRFSGPIQLLRNIDRDKITVSAAWNFLAAVQSLLRTDLDYRRSSGINSESPIVLQDNSTTLQKMIWYEINKLGLSDAQNQAIVDLMNGPLGLSDGTFTSPAFLDPVVRDRQFLRTTAAPHTLSITNLSAADSKQDIDYEIRVLLNSALFYESTLRHHGQNSKAELRSATFSVTTTDAQIQSRLKALAPTSTTSHPWQSAWHLSESAGSVGLNLMQATVMTYEFSFADLERLAKMHPEIFNQAVTQPAVRQSNFFREQFLTRPIGL